MNYFAKFEQFLPHSIIILSFMTVRSQLPALHGGWGVVCLPRINKVVKIPTIN